MKKLLLFVLAITCVLSYSGCSANQPINNASPSASGVEPIVTESSSPVSQTIVPEVSEMPPQESNTTKEETEEPSDENLSSLNTPDPTSKIVFEDKELERLIKKVLGKDEITKADLDEIANVSVVGTYISIKTIHDELIGDKVTSYTNFGTQFEVNGVWSHEKGNLKTLNDFSQFANLSTLSIWYQGNLNIDALRQLKNLSVLVLSNDEISDISVLSELTQLSYLDLTNNPIADYSPLDGLKNTRMRKEEWTMK